MRRFWNLTNWKPNTNSPNQEESYQANVAADQEAPSFSSGRDQSVNSGNHDLKCGISNPTGNQYSVIQNVPPGNMFDGQIPLNPAWADLYYAELRKYADSINLDLMEEQPLFQQVVDKVVLDHQGQLLHVLHDVGIGICAPQGGRISGNSIEDPANIGPNPEVSNTGRIDQAEDESNRNLEMFGSSNQDGNQDGGMKNCPTKVFSVRSTLYYEEMSKYADTIHLVLVEEQPLLPQIIAAAVQDSMNQLGQLIRDVGGCRAEACGDSEVQTENSSGNADEYQGNGSEAPKNPIEEPPNREIEPLSILNVPAVPTAPVKVTGPLSGRMTTRSVSAKAPRTFEKMEAGTESCETSSEDSDSDDEVPRQSQARASKRPVFKAKKGKSPKTKRARK